MASPKFNEERSQVRRVARNPKCGFEYSYHALQRMRERGVTRAEVRRVVENGYVDSLDIEYGEERIRVCGFDSDERKLTVVVVLNDEDIRIEVVTVWAK